MLLYVFVFIFYASGTWLAISRNGSELSLWILAFGIVLDLAMLYFDWTGATFAPRLGEGDLAAKVLRLITYFMWGVAFFLRVLPKIDSFKWLVGIAFGVWLVFFVRSLSLHYRKKRSA
jgi:hypothetical protein